MSRKPPFIIAVLSLAAGLAIMAGTAAATDGPPANPQPPPQNGPPPPAVLFCQHPTVPGYRPVECFVINNTHDTMYAIVSAEGSGTQFLTINPEDGKPVGFTPAVGPGHNIRVQLVWRAGSLHDHTSTSVSI